MGFVLLPNGHSQQVISRKSGSTPANPTNYSLKPHRGVSSDALNQLVLEEYMAMYNNKG